VGCRLQQALRQAALVIEITVQVNAAFVVQDQRMRSGRLRGADHAGGEQCFAQRRQAVARRGDIGQMRADVA